MKAVERSGAMATNTFESRPQAGDVSKICCIGAGYVGGPTSAVIALMNPQIQVSVVDLNEKLIQTWNSNTPPIWEPGLRNVLEIIATRSKSDNTSSTSKGSKSKNLCFSTNVDQAIADAGLILLSVETPTKINGKGSGFAADVTSIEKAVRQIARVSRGYKIVVEKSTVPCKTSDAIRDILAANAHEGATFDVISNPEFLAEGTAIKNLIDPDRVLIGSFGDERGHRAADALAAIYAAWVPSSKIIRVNVFSSELAKLAANALLAQRISSVNALSAICEKTGADIEEVTHSCGLDGRIGHRMLNASVGFGGSCFRKDLLSLVYLAETLHLPEVAQYWKGVIDINDYQTRRFSERVISSLFNTVKGKKIAVLGFAYKKDTGDTRETPAASLVKNLLAERAQIHIYDPRAIGASITKALVAAGVSTSTLEHSVKAEESPYDACCGADAVLVLTEWDMFSNKSTNLVSASDSSKYISALAALKLSSPEEGFGKHIPDRLDWSRIAKGMNKPMSVFDGRNILDQEKLRLLGFQVWGVGKPSSASI